MHIPDGFLDTKTWAGTAAVSAGLVSYSLARAREELAERRAPLIGLVAAFIFAAEMVNFPVALGTSGHLIGAVLAALTLGPWTASLVMTTVLIVQCLVFGDGGITALGANIANMAFVATFAGYAVYRAISRLGRPRLAGLTALETAAVAAAAWFSVVAAAAACSAELAVSGTVPLRLVLPAMLFWHTLIGLGEAAITTAIVLYLWRIRPELRRGLGREHQEARATCRAPGDKEASGA